MSHHPQRLQPGIALLIALLLLAFALMAAPNAGPAAGAFGQQASSAHTAVPMSVYAPGH